MADGAPAIPSVSECVALMDQYAMYPNIRHHSLVVAGVGACLIQGLMEVLPPGRYPGKDLVISGALLHDIAKTPCLHGQCNHARKGAEICERHGYPDIGRIVKDHVILNHHDPERYRQGEFTASEIVYYADKRVRHTDIVSLEERLTYILDRYSRNEPQRRRHILKNFALCVELEQHLFDYLAFEPDELVHRVETNADAAELFRYRRDPVPPAASDPIPGKQK